MKYLYLFLAISVSFVSNAQSWSWAKAPTGISSGTTAQIAGVAHDGFGHIYAVGYFEFGVINFGTVSVTNPAFIGGSEILVVKYDTSGNVIWARTAPVSGVMANYCTSVATDAHGDVYVTGFYEADTITFGSTHLSSSYYGNMFIVKYDSSGTVLWAKNGVDYGARVMPATVCVGASGNIYVTGTFGAYYATFNGTDTLHNIVPYYTTGFLIKYSPSGNIVWKKAYGGFINTINPAALATDDNENVYVSFKCTDTAVAFGSTTFPIKNLALAKYDSSGNIQWVISGGNGYNDYGGPLTTDRSGHVYWASTFEDSTVTVGGFTLTNVSSSHKTDIFIVKCDTAGTVLAAKSAGSSQNDYANSMTTDFEGNVYLTGSFSGATIGFGPDTLIQGGTTDIYVAKYDSTLTPQWARQAGGTNGEQGNAICGDQRGNLYIAGTYSSDSAHFGSCVITGSFTTNFNLFMSKLDNPLPIVTTSTPFSAAANDYSVYPNPCHEALNVSSGDVITNVAILDQLGRTVLVRDCNSNNTRMNLPALPPGLYVLKINGLYFTKFVKE